MKRILMLLFVIQLLTVSAVFAAEVTPFIKSGKLNVSYEEKVNVSEKITLANAQAIPEGKLEHILTKIDGARVENLVVKANNEELKFDIKEGKSVDKIMVSLPERVEGDFNYTISYSYPNVEIEKVPFLVPGVSSAGNGNVITMTVNLAKGKYIHESFPIIDSGDSGTVKENMMNIPSFVGLKTGSSPAGFFTTSNIYTIFGLAVILGIILAWIISERKTKAGEVVNV